MVLAHFLDAGLRFISFRRCLLLCLAQLISQLVNRLVVQELGGKCLRRVEHLFDSPLNLRIVAVNRLSRCGERQIELVPVR